MTEQFLDVTQTECWRFARFTKYKQSIAPSVAFADYEKINISHPKKPFKVTWC